MDGISLTVKQLRTMLEAAEAYEENGGERDESHEFLFSKLAHFQTGEDGEQLPPGIYMADTQCVEEGWMLLAEDE